MILLPVIERELRAAARRSFTYHLRVLGVLALLVALVLFVVRGNLGPGVGLELFRWLHSALFLAIWTLVPLLCIDVISRERREGTLPLLFLTPLNARDIVYAKTLAQGLRTLTLWLAVLPVLAVAFLAGGVSWMEVLFSALINFSAACLALAAGLAASARNRVWTRALALGLILAVGSLLVFLAIVPWVVQLAVYGRWLADSAEEGSLSQGFALAVNSNGAWQDLLTAGRSSVPAMAGFGALALISLLFFLLMVRFAAWSTRRFWREQPLSERAARLQARLCRPIFFQRALRRWLNWQLRRNPIGWLEQRSWTGRLVVWSWLAVVICVYSSLFANLGLYQRGFHGLQSVMALVLAASIALSAAGSFRRERETGVLELLLVAPIREWQIIGGRVRGLWSQFLPSVLLLYSVWLYAATFLGGRDELPTILQYAVTFATLPVVGLYFSLATANFIAAFLATLLLQVIVPQVLAQLCAWACEPPVGAPPGNEPGLLELVVSVLLQVLISLFVAWRLHHNLKRRTFALETRDR
jgi:ABC-type transport system involved in multi-copper enzyme maturation permease subunit